MSMGFGGYAATGGHVMVRTAAEAPRCRLCNHDLTTATVVGTMARYDKPSRRVVCPQCSLVQVSPQPSEAEIDAYYSGEFWSTDGAKAVLFLDGVAHEQGTPGYEHAATVRAELFAKRFAQDTKLPPGASILEVGCGDGRTLAALSAMGYGVCGVERDDGKRAEASLRVSGYVFPSTSTLSDGSYDAVCAWHVLEHTRDPLAFLADLRRLVKPGGVVYVEVPNTLDPMGPLAENWWQWAHLFDFTPHTLFATLRAAGLAIERGNVVAGPWLVRGWGYETGEPARAWEPTGHEDTAGLVHFLAAHDARYVREAPPSKSTLERFLEGESVLGMTAERLGFHLIDDIGVADEVELGAEAVEREIRRELAAWRDDVNRMAQCYREATDMVGTIGDQYDDDAVKRLESWHPDPYVHGFTMGEGFAMLRARGLLAYLGNAMKMKEVADAARWEGK